MEPSPAVLPEEGVSSGGMADGVMKDGDLVILWGRDPKAVVLKRGELFSHSTGRFPHNDLIGKPFGVKVFSRESVKRRNKWWDRGYVVAMKPTPELWTEGALSHRTQILFTGDVATVCFYLDMKPGCVVMESGSGSGSLSRAIARTVAPDGHLYTFEFNESRYQALRDDFIREGLTDVIHISHCDVYEEGLVPSGVSGCEGGRLDAEGWVDAVFLDLPDPTLVLPDAWKRLKPEGKVCTFVPSVEQVKSSCAMMEQVGFRDVFTVEVRVRPYNAYMSTDYILDLEYRAAEASASAAGEPDRLPAVPADCRKRKEREELPPSTQEGPSHPTETAPKPQRGAGNGKERRRDKKPPLTPEGVESQQTERLVVSPTSECAGHTGFLSFGYKPG